MLQSGFLKTKQRPALGGRGEGWKHSCIAKSKGREAVEHNYTMYIYTWTPHTALSPTLRQVCYEYVSRVVKRVVGNICGSVCQDFGSLLHLDMFNSHPCAKSEILFNYINKVPCFAFWASSTHSQKIYICNVLRMKTRLVLDYCIRMDSGIISKVVQSESVRNKEGIEKTLNARVRVS